MYQLVLFPSIGGYTMHYRFFLEKHVKLFIRPRAQDSANQPAIVEDQQDSCVSIELEFVDALTFYIKLDTPLGWRYDYSAAGSPQIHEARVVSKKDSFPRKCTYGTWFGIYPPPRKDESGKETQEELLLGIGEHAQQGMRVKVVEKIPSSWEVVREFQTAL